MSEQIEVGLRLRIARQDTELLALREKVAELEIAGQALVEAAATAEEAAEQAQAKVAELEQDQKRLQRLRSRLMAISAMPELSDTAIASMVRDWTNQWEEEPSHLEAELRTARDLLQRIYDCDGIKVEPCDFHAEIGRVLARQEAEPEQGAEPEEEYDEAARGADDMIKILKRDEKARGMEVFWAWFSRVPTEAEADMNMWDDRTVAEQVHDYICAFRHQAPRANDDLAALARQEAEPNRRKN
jgi:small-conductance mechanosensitive channel